MNELSPRKVKEQLREDASIGLDCSPGNPLSKDALEVIVGLEFETNRRLNLIKEARELILAMGESTDVPIQFRQHGLLRMIQEEISMEELRLEMENEGSSKEEKNNEA